MLWNPVALACGLTFSVMMGLIFVSSVRRSSFGWLIISVEYFYVLGLGLFPLLLSLGIIENPELLADYELKNGELRIATFVHIFLYGLGALHGYFFARQVAKKVSQRVVRIALANNINNYGWFYFLSGLTIVFSVLHFSFVGLDTALLNVAFARSGDFSGLVGFEQYQFLKNLAMLGLYSIVFVPYIIIDGKHILSAFVIVAVVATFIYLQTAARVTMFETIGTFFILYFALGRRRGGGFILMAGVVVALLTFIFVYGKTFVGALSSYLFAGRDLELIRHGADDDSVAYFFNHFGHLPYSVDAGIRHFFLYGPALAKDVLLSPLGIVPSFMFSAVGLDSLSYQLVPANATLACINTDYFRPFGECFVPAYLPGFSAYVLPFVGAFMFGFVRFWIYAVIENCWLKLRTRPELLWLPYVLFLVEFRLMLVIPATIAFAVFMSLLVLSLLTFKLMFKRFSAVVF